MILIFAGAGASTAVSNEKYPTTIEYFNKLEASITNNPLFKLAKSNIEDAGESLDIENILFRLIWINDKMNLGYQPNDIKWKYFRECLIQYKLSPQTEDLINTINRKIYGYYGQFPDDSELTNNWKLLFEELKTKDERLEVFTTNYDTVIESALVRFDAKNELNISDGFTNSETGEASLNQTNWQFNKDTQNGLLTKLHGSINWGGRNTNIWKQPSRFTGNEENHPIIYPGFKGKPNSNPYRLFHDYFTKCLQFATHIITIGFAFRDEYINTCFSKLNGSAKITNIGWQEEPSEIPPHIKTGDYSFLEQGFGKEAVVELKKRL